MAAGQGPAMEGALAAFRVALDLYFEDEDERIVFAVPLVIRGRVSREAPSSPSGKFLWAMHKTGFQHISTRGSHANVHRPDGRIVIVPLHRGAFGLWHVRLDVASGGGWYPPPTWRRVVSGPIGSVTSR